MSEKSFRPMLTYSDETHRLKMCKNLSSYKVYYDAHDRLELPHLATQLDWIMKQSKCSILFFDHDQIVFPMGIDVGKAIQNNSFDTRMMSYYTLLNQMRCKGGMTYLEDIKSLVHGTIDHKVCTDNYEIRIAKILSEKAFTFSPTQYLSIHRELFLGIYQHAGKILHNREMHVSGKFLLGHDDPINDTIKHNQRRNGILRMTMQNGTMTFNEAKVQYLEKARKLLESLEPEQNRSDLYVQDQIGEMALIYLILIKYILMWQMGRLTTSSYII